jgi:hypothetical protein
VLKSDAKFEPEPILDDDDDCVWVAAAPWKWPPPCARVGVLRLTSSGLGSDAGDGADGAKPRGDWATFLGVTRPDSTESPGGADVVTLVLRSSDSVGRAAGDNGVAFFFGDGAAGCAPQALAVSDVFVDVEVAPQPRGDVDSTCSTPLSEKLPNWSERLDATLDSQRPSFRYLGLVAEPAEVGSERATGISFGETGVAGAELADSGVTIGLPRDQALGVCAVFFSVVFVVVAVEDADQSPMFVVDTSSVPQAMVDGSSVFEASALGDATFSWLRRCRDLLGCRGLLWACSGGLVSSTYWGCWHLCGR